MTATERERRHAIGKKMEDFHKDAELLALGRLFELLHTAFWAIADRFEAKRHGDDINDVNEDDASRVLDDMWPIMEAIKALRSYTKASERVKLLAWAHCQDCADENLEDQLKGCSWEALRASILINLLKEHNITLRQKVYVLE